MYEPPFHAGFVSPCIRSWNAASDSAVHDDRPLCACFFHSAPRSFPLHWREHVGVLTLAACDGGRVNVVPHTAQVRVIGMAIWYRVLFAAAPVDTGPVAKQAALAKPGPVQPRDAVADLESGVLHGTREPVPGPGPAEREHVPAGLEDAQALDGPQLAPLLECLR